MLHVDQTQGGSACPQCGSELIELKEILELLREILRILQGVSKTHLTTAEAADLVGRSEDTVRRWIRNKQLRATRIQGTGPRGRLLIPREELERLVTTGHGQQIPAIALSSRAAGSFSGAAEQHLWAETA